jgi:hypothetical protein
MFRKLSLATIVLVASCGETPSEPTLSGIYDLVAVEGAPLPAALPGGVDGVPATATSGTASLASDHSVLADLRLTLQNETSPIKTSYTLSGTYTVGRDTVYMKDTASGHIVLAVISGSDGSRLTAMVEGLRFAFDRRPVQR